MNYIRFFEELSHKDVAIVGGKNASLGHMIQRLTRRNILVPSGFAVTADAYWYYLAYNNIDQALLDCMNRADSSLEISVLRECGAQARALIMNGVLPEDLADQILHAYKQLSERYKMALCDVAVRSSATAEDLPQASFAGQQETYLNIQGEEALLLAVKKCLASLFTDRAIAYRKEHGFDHMSVALSVGVQKMVRSDKASSGVLFTLDTETGYRDVVVITGSYGLGETVVQGAVNPDQFVVHKPTLKKGFRSIVSKELGSKETQMVYDKQATKVVPVDEDRRYKYCLSDDEILSLARSACLIEDDYALDKEQPIPMDIEWAKDGDDGLLYIIQARPETVFSQQKGHSITMYKKDAGQSADPLATGLSIGQKIAVGTARVVAHVADLSLFNPGDIIVTTMTDPDWMPILRTAGGIVTELGGRTCHAAIVSRELGIPAIIGTGNATKVVADGQIITIDCSQGAQGIVYNGALSFVKEVVAIDSLQRPVCDVLVNVADPERAFIHGLLPVDGVGLARLEFIINAMGIHPMAVCEPDKVDDANVLEAIGQRARAYSDPKTFYVQTLAQGIATIAAAFYPRPVVVRLTDFKTNEYRDLLGGKAFEPYEENPMLGFRGAVRYTSKHYAPAFELECVALKQVREEMGLTNVHIMVPFVRTVAEAASTVALLEKNGLVRGKDGLKFLMMVEIPTNVILIEKYAEHFDGFSIGSNDLTQLTLGVDRDSGILSSSFDERDEAVMKMLELAIKGALKAQKTISICGQAPSDFPEVADFLIRLGIHAVSLNADAVLPFLTRKK